jgi:hypothetical protein
MNIGRDLRGRLRANNFHFGVGTPFVLRGGE